MHFRRAAAATLALCFFAVAHVGATSPGKEKADATATTFTDSGEAKYTKGDLDGAIVDYEKAIKLDPGFARAYYSRGLARYDQGNVKDAIADYNEAIKLNPQFEDAYVNR